MLTEAILGVDPRIIVLGFDSEVFPLQRSSVQGLHHRFRTRCQSARHQGKRFLDMLDLEKILRLARRFAPATTQGYLLIVSDLFLHRQRTLPPDDPQRIQQMLLAYRKTWLVDTWPVGEPFTAYEDGTMTCSARGLLELIEREGETYLENLAWREAETGSIWHLSASTLARLAVVGEQVVLEARRFTPYLHDLGFVSSEQATSASRLLHVRPSSCAEFAAIFREAQPC